MFGTTNDIQISRKYKIESIYETIEGTISLRPNNEGQTNYAAVFVNDMFVFTLYDDMGDKLLEMLNEMRD